MSRMKSKPYQVRHPDKKQTRLSKQSNVSYPIGRIIVEDGTRFSPKEAGKHLNYTIKHHWPQASKVDILITPGAFIDEEKPDEWGQKNKKWEATTSDVKRFIDSALINVKKMLTSSSLLDSAKGKIKYISIGSDISYSDGYWGELVVLINVNTGNIENWTGKSYPTSGSEERKLLQITDLKTHFKKIAKHKVMILGCHDLYMFHCRGPKLESGEETNKSKRRKAMNEIAKEFNPNVVIQHPHTAESVKVWGDPWNKLINEYREVKAYASGICYFETNSKKNTIDKVLESTSSGSKNVLDVMLRVKE